MRKTPNILLILNHFLPRHIAGTEIYCYRLGKELAAAGNEVAFVIPGYGKKETDEYTFDGLRVVEFAEPSTVDRELKMGLRVPDGLQSFKDVLAHEEPDVVHFHELAGSNGISIFHVKAAKEAGYKVVMTFHLGRYTATSDNLKLPVDIFDNRRACYNFYMTKGFGKLAASLLYYPALLLQLIGINTGRFGRLGIALSVPRLVEKKREDFIGLTEHCDQLITIARWYHNALEANGVNDKKLAFIEQGISLSEPVNSVRQTRGETLRVIFVGRISHFKGVKQLIQAVIQLDHSQLQLDIYGDSGENDDYIKKCRGMAKGLTNIRFMGRLSPEETLATMSGYDVLVLPSTFSEMSPLVILEAYAAGIPVLASDSPGAAEQIRGGVNGWLFRMNDVEDLKSKLQLLIDYPDKIEEAKKHLPKIRSMKEVAEEHQLLYLGLLANQKTMVD